MSLFFLSLANPAQAIERVAARVFQGGHHIPEEVIMRRFDKGLESFYTVYQSLVDHWFHYDNSGTRPGLITSSRNPQSDV